MHSQPSAGACVRGDGERRQRRAPRGAARAAGRLGKVCGRLVRVTLCSCRHRVPYQPQSASLSCAAPQAADRPGSGSRRPRRRPLARQRRVAAGRAGAGGRARHQLRGGGAAAGQRRQRLQRPERWGGGPAAARRCLRRRPQPRRSRARRAEQRRSLRRQRPQSRWRRRRGARGRGAGGDVLPCAAAVSPGAHGVPRGGALCARLPWLSVRLHGGGGD